MHAAGHYIFPANFGPERLAEHRDDRVDRSPWRSYVPIALKPPGESDFDVATLGVSMATKLWASRLAEYGIDVYEVRPSIISTDMTAGVTKKYDSLIETWAHARQTLGHTRGCRDCHLGVGTGRSPVRHRSGAHDRRGTHRPQAVRNEAR